MFNDDFTTTHRSVRRMFGVGMIVMCILSIASSAAVIYLIYAAAKWLTAHS
jgi:hypothetical protein